MATSDANPLGYAAPALRSRSKRRYLLWAVGAVVIGGMLIAALLPSLCRPRETANRVKCASNLRQIGQAITLYAQDHNGEYPASLSNLLANSDLTAETMTCPSSNDDRSTAADTNGIVADIAAAETNAPNHKNCLSYVYLGRGMNSKTVGETTAIVYEPLSNHEGDGANVLFGDGHVECVGKHQWPTIATAAGIPIASSVSQ